MIPWWYFKPFMSSWWHSNQKLLSKIHFYQKIADTYPSRRIDLNPLGTCLFLVSISEKAFRHLRKQYFRHDFIDTLNYIFSFIVTKLRPLHTRATLLRCVKNINSCFSVTSETSCIELLLLDSDLKTNIALF